jgi:hypothetical protein
MTLIFAKGRESSVSQTAVILSAAKDPEASKLTTEHPN